MAVHYLLISAVRGSNRISNNTVDAGAFELQQTSGGSDLSYTPITEIPSLEVLGTPNDDVLPGTNAAEYFKALAGSDREIGKGGNDVFLMGPGRDFIGGGGGNDTALFDGDIADYSGLSFDGDLVYFVTDLNPDDGDSGRDRLSGVETFEFKDAIFDATTGEVTQKGTSDLSYKPETKVPATEILGTPNDDTLPGTNSAEYFKALEGSDREIGKGSNDVFLMGPGRDFIGGGGGRDTALFDGSIQDFSGLTYDGDLVYIVTDLNRDDGNSGRDRLGGVETFEFRDALFDATTGDVTLKGSGITSTSLAQIVEHELLNDSSADVPTGTNDELLLLN